MNSRILAVLISLFFGLLTNGNAAAQVQAGMSLNDTLLCSGDEIIATDNSSGGVSRKWIVNGNAQGTASTLKITANSAGTYSIQLVVSDAGGSSDTAIQFCRVKELPSYSINFDQGYGDITICLGTELTVSHWSNVGGAESVSWDFGDGGVSDVMYPRHTYHSAGEYTVKVTVNGYCGSGTFDRKVKVTNQPDGRPQIGINAPNEVCPGEEFNIYVSEISGMGSDSFLVYLDGYGSTHLIDFYTSFQAEQNVNIQAIGFNQCGMDTVNYTVRVTDTAEHSFYLYAYPNLVCPNQSVQVQMPIYDDGFALIDFGDGTKDTFNSEHYYASHSYSMEGTYIVNAIVNPVCGKSDTLEYTVVVDRMSTPNGYGIYIPMSTVCLGEYLAFYTPNLQIGDTFLVNFGNGDELRISDYSQRISYQYNQTGYYLVKTKLINRCGNFKTYDIGFNVSNSAAFKPSININYSSDDLSKCVRDTLNFSVMVPGERLVGNIEWLFSDGYRSSGSSLVKRVLTSTGTYLVRCRVQNLCGEYFEVGKYFDVIDHTMAPKVNFWIFPEVECTGEMILIDNFTRNTDSMIVNFGDGTIKEIDPDEFHTNYTYTKSGLYKVKLVAVNGCGIDSGQVQFRSVAGPDVDIVFDKSSYLPGDTVKMIAAVSAYRELEWEFPDGQKSMESTPYLVAGQMGTYSVHLRALSLFGCETSIEEEFTVGQIGVEVRSQKFSSRIYPNPTEGMLTIETDPENSITQIELIDNYGRLVWSEKGSKNCSSICKVNMRQGTLSSGLYLLRIQTVKGTEYGRVYLK